MLASHFLQNGARSAQVQLHFEAEMRISKQSQPRPRLFPIIWFRIFIKNYFAWKSNFFEHGWDDPDSVKGAQNAQKRANSAKFAISES